MPPENMYEKMTKKCELCSKKVARMYCVSDQANLCWDCDSRVHSANFLVAKHVRTLLCHACKGPTPWTGSGPKLTPTVSVCQPCLNTKDDDDDDDDDHDDDDAEHDEDDQNGREVNDHTDDDDDDGENQVVPLSPSLPSSFASTSYSNEGPRNNFS